MEKSEHTAPPKLDSNGEYIRKDGLIQYDVVSYPVSYDLVRAKELIADTFSVNFNYITNPLSFPVNINNNLINKASNEFFKTFASNEVDRVVDFALDIHR